VFDCDGQDVLLFLISLISTKHALRSFHISNSVSRGVERTAFLWSTPGGI